jgi:serine/threonine protein kinase
MFSAKVPCEEARAAFKSASVTFGWGLGAARGPETVLDWGTRIRIAAEAAHGLLHLHTVEKMVHGNLTATNILLDTSASPTVNACISDYGLSRLMTPAANANVVATARSLGYRAPELTKIKRASTKSDVYSFGIILLELLTGTTCL